MDAEWGQRPGHREAVARELEKLHLSIRIREAREARGWTQAKLAAAVGTTQSAIARLEAAEVANLKLDTLLRLAQALKGQVQVHFPKARAKVRT